MASKSIFADLVHNESGAYSASYGAFVLQSALQPIFSNRPETGLEIEALEGLVRVSRNDEPIAARDFFSLVAREDIANVDSILRTLHILNSGLLGRRRVRIFVKFQSGLFRTPAEMRQEVDRIKLAGHQAGLKPDSIVCEISERSGDSDDIVVAFTEHMRAIGFRIAIHDYRAGDSDLARLKRIKPDYVKFDAPWIGEFVMNSAGHALLRVLVRQLLEDGIEPIFEGLEELWQLDLCEEIGVPLMQGYALAMPEMAPTTFNNVFPESSYVARPTGGITQGVGRISSAGATLSTTASSPLARRGRVFGRRQSNGK